MRLVNRDVAATGIPRPCKLRVRDDDGLNWSVNAYVETWDGYSGIAQGIYPASGSDPVSALIEWPTTRRTRSCTRSARLAGMRRPPAWRSRHGPRRCRRLVVLRRRRSCRHGNRRMARPLTKRRRPEPRGAESERVATIGPCAQPGLLWSTVTRKGPPERG